MGTAERNRVQTNVANHRQPAGVTYLPTDMRALFDTASADPDSGLSAAIAIARYRKRHGTGPTFSELFEILYPHRDIDWDADRRLTFSFRHHLAVHWRRQGWIRWSRAPRSLMSGPQFQIASAQYARARSLKLGRTLDP